MPEGARITDSGPDSGPDSGLLARSRTAWELADWPTLAALASQPLEPDRDRARLALLAAVGLAQLGRMDQARGFVMQARDWGCPAPLMAQVLVGGALNSLGRVACLLGDDARARGYFEESVRIVSPRADAAILGRARDISEKAALGLLPEAAGMLDPGGPDTGGLEGSATSQLGQDLWVLEQTGHKRGGFFVEFGATDGVLLSNTLLLERGFGWRGICAEPNPRFFAQLKANRSCITAPDCILGRSGQSVEFILADEFVGVVDFADTDEHADKREAFRSCGEVITLRSISLEDFLRKYDAPRTIDYLSIDTEGSEYDILRDFPFADWDIRLLSIEHNFMPVRADIRALMQGHGYHCTEMRWDDWYSKAPAA